MPQISQLVDQVGAELSRRQDVRCDDEPCDHRVSDQLCPVRPVAVDGGTADPGRFSDSSLSHCIPTLLTEELHSGTECRLPKPNCWRRFRIGFTNSNGTIFTGRHLVDVLSVPPMTCAEVSHQP